VEAEHFSINLQGDVMSLKLASKPHEGLANKATNLLLEAKMESTSRSTSGPQATIDDLVAVVITPGSTN
jgi:hypothetical protein